MRSLFFLSAVVLVAGCFGEEAAPTEAGAPPPANSTVAATAAPSAAPTEEFGSIAVTVTTVELQPIDRVQVTIHGTDYAAMTDAAGAATFNDLPPGPYTVLAAKPGYKSLDERGKQVEVLAGEVTGAKIVMEPIPVINSETSYHRTLEFRGFISCSFDSRALGYTSYCGRGLTVSGQTVGRDANDNSTHAWPVESPLISAVILEAKWTPSFAALGTDMMIRTAKAISCSAYACQPGASFGAIAAGASPLRAATFETADYQLGNAIQPDPTKYPHTVYSEGRAYCNPQCQASYGNNIFIQQSYQMWATAFYGAPPDSDWTVLPS